MKPIFYCEGFLLDECLYNGAHLALNSTRRDLSSFPN